MSGDVGPSIFVSGRIVVFRWCSTSAENPSKERNDGMEHTIYCVRLMLMYSVARHYIFVLSNIK